MQCRYCNTQIADNALICYRCGRATSDPKVKPPSEGSIFEHRRRQHILAIDVGHVAVIDRARLGLGQPHGDLADLPAVEPILSHQTEVAFSVACIGCPAGYFLMLVSSSS